MAMRWKKHPAKTGLAAVGAGPRGSDLRDGEARLATVYCARERHRETGWYWVSCVSGEIVNTCNKQAPDESTAKAEAFAHVKNHYPKDAP